jgi:hypothetical protein
MVRPPNQWLTQSGGDEFEHKTRIGAGSVGAGEN